MQKMLKNPYGKNWEVSSFYTIYCVAAHAKNTIYCDIPVCNSLKIPRLNKPYRFKSDLGHQKF